MSKRSIFAIGKNYITAVEIAKSYLKVSQAEASAKGIIISSLITKPISGFSDDEISKTLADIISTSHIKLDRLVVIISRDRAMVRYLRLPTAKAEEIDSMVSFEVARQMPYSKEEVISDYETIGTDSEGYSEIMLAIVHKNEVARVNNILSSIEKRPDQIRLSSEAISSCIKAVAKEETTQKNICLLDIDTDSTEIAVISDGRLEFSRVASIGAANTSQSEPEVDFWKGRLIDELKRSIGMYIKEKDKDASAISEFLVTGAGSVIEDISNYIQDQMNITCRSLNILLTLPFAKETLSEEGIPRDVSVCAVCGGLFISEGINLIPAELRRKEKVKVKTKKLVAILILAMVGVVLLSATALVGLYQKDRLRTRLKDMLKQIEPQAKATEDKLKKLRVIKQQLSEGTTSLDAIYHLYRLIPADIFLIDFDYEDKDRMVSFRATAPRMSDVFNLATILEKSDRFSNVQTRSASKSGTAEGEAVDFQIRCNFILEETKE